MGKYILKRILAVIPTILIVIFIIFGIMDLTPGDPARLILGNKATDEEIAALTAEMGYDKPFLVRYVNYVGDLLKGDMGDSWRTKRPVWDEITQRLPTTAKLAATAMLFALVIGIPLGILSAVKQYSIFDAAGTTFAMIMAALPSFWFGMMLIIVFAVNLNILPSYGVGSFKHYIMPALALSCAYMAMLLRLTRTTMLETIRTDYVRTARAKGQKEGLVIFDHALSNAMLPVVTVVGTSFCELLGGVVTVETVFTINGIGMMIITAIQSKDIPLVTGGAIFLASMVTILLLVVDIVYAFLDPRIRARYQTGK